MSEIEFINRKKETEQIISCINNRTSENQILVLAGTSGVGKSGLVKMILEKKLAHRLSVNVEIYNNTSATIDNLYYLNELYRAMVQNNSNDSKGIATSPLLYSVTSIKNLFRFGTEVAWAKTVGSETRLYEPLDDGSVLRKKNYIINLLRKRNYIIYIENVQDIDNQSFEVLRDIMQQVAKTTLILEFNINNSHNFDDFYSFYNALESFNANVFPYKIEKLNFSEAKKIAPSNVDDAYLKAIYQEGRGNLVQMRLSASITDSRLDPIQFQLSVLPKNDFFIINLVYLNGGKIEQEVLYQIILNGYPSPPFTEQIIDHCIRDLQRRRIMELDRMNSLRIVHDSIISALEVQKNNPMMFTAFQALKRYYLDKVEKYADENSLEHLTSLLINFSDEDILRIFPHVLLLIKSYKYKHSAIAKLVWLRESLVQNKCTNPNIIYELSLSLSTFCMELGFAKEAQDSLDLIYNDDNAYHRALQAAIYMIDFTNSSSVKCAEEMAKKATSPKEKLTIELFILAGKMSLLPSEECLCIATEMLNTPEYKNLFEYAFLLRDYAELATDEEDSISAYEQTVALFRQFKRNDLCAQVLVALSMFLAYRGDLDNARKLLERAENNESVPKKYIINNRAVIDILDGKTEEKTANALNNVLLITSDPYENLIVRCNLMVCYILLGDAKRATLIRDSILEDNYSAFRYEEFLHIIYQNLYYYHSSFGNSKEASQYKHRISNLIKNLPHNSFTYRLASLQLAGVPSKKEFYSNFAFRVDFLGNWDLEISRDLECY